MQENLKCQILKNNFVIQVRTQLRFDQDAYDELCNLLQQLALELRGHTTIDRELMSSLYEIPLMIRNSFEALSHDMHPHKIKNKLEDAWIELDRLVASCLVDAGN